MCESFIEPDNLYLRLLSSLKQVFTVWICYFCENFHALKMLDSLHGFRCVFTATLRPFFYTGLVQMLTQAAEQGRLPVMNISFGGPLANTCGFVDDPNIISSLNASIQALSEIEVVREECQSLKTNSIVFLNEYINYTNERQSELIVAKENKQVLEQLIGDAQAAGTYAGEYDLDLMSASQEVARQENKELMQSESLAWPWAQFQIH